MEHITRGETDSAEAKEDSFWSNRQSNCDHEYGRKPELKPSIIGEIIFLDCECSQCGKHAVEVYNFSHYIEKE